MKFVADVMLGKLAKRMRLLGFDVAYDRTATDNEIIRVSLEEDRVILTRDTGLTRRPLASRHLFIESDDPNEQLGQVLKKFELLPGRALTRCSVCNAPLAAVRKDEVRNIVAQYIYEKYSTFFRCDECKRMYWIGSHVQRMRATKKAGS